MKITTAFLPTLFICLSAIAQEQTAPFSLRADLLQNPSQVYEHGISKDIPLEQAVLSGGRFQFCQVNSRYPMFSWVLPSQYQSAYQILVASNRQMLQNDSADIWNSGKIKSNNSTGVLYSGPALQASTCYYWKVRTWDQYGKPGRYAAIQVFSTGKEPDDYRLPSFVLIRTPQQPLKTSTPDADNVLYDFGKDAFSQIKLSVNAQHHDDTLILHLGEAVTPDGHVNKHPPGSVRYRMIKIPLQQGQHVYQPDITPDARNTKKNAILMPAAIGEVLPFRYVEIVRGGYTIDNVSRYMVSSTFDDTATTFQSGYKSLNQIWDLCKYTIKATSFSGYYVDGDRERIPYEADALINQLSHYATDAEFTMAKRTLNYLIDHPTWPTEWSLQNVLIAWNDYLYSGDLRLAKKLYPDLKAKLLSALAREDGLISTRTGKQTPAFLQSIHYAAFDANAQLKDITDWPPPKFGGTDIMGETDGFVFADYNAVVNAYYYAGLEAMAKLAKAMGNTADADHYKREAARVQTAFQRVFIDKQTNLVVDGEGVSHSSLHANFFALAFGLIPHNKVPGVLSFIHSRGMACSVYGAQFLLDGLYKVNDADYALQLLTSTDKRSWFNMMREGATMTMEAWGQEYKPNQDWGHAWGAAPANCIIRYIAGIQPITPGFGEVEIRPQPGLTGPIQLRYKTIRGTIEEEIENTPARCRLQLTLPGNMTGHIYLPFATDKATVSMDGKVIKAVYNGAYYEIRNIAPGRHTFEVYSRN
ncbi:alpha-L-rhamnosidase [Chitinophaga sp. YR627]|uniref:alpha-L-rhamnosidase-related protein n=1 Tax=Chitinophaga sp. YR627 TaxID=1881041 RepID=UPI0008E3830F|nr:alpha-L-rhamnosidase C-terminal domain-containing protein [Chitinophaga sp. YR627]SFO54632.1 alpha-L-rhamnosidase [Chitinophaga sp. YR627]